MVPLSTVAAAASAVTAASAPPRGAFILLEGLDRSGKTTQSQMLVERLQQSGSPAVPRHFPDRSTATGKIINDYLKNKEVAISDHVIHLLFSANRWEAVDDLTSTLASGTTIVCDRYAFSGVAFSNAKGLNQQWCQAPDKGLPAPDHVLYLDVPLNEAEKRGGYACASPFLILSFFS